MKISGDIFAIDLKCKGIKQWSKTNFINNLKFIDTFFYSVSFDIGIFYLYTGILFTGSFYFENAKFGKSLI